MVSIEHVNSEIERARKQYEYIKHRLSEINDEEDLTKLHLELITCHATMASQYSLWGVCIKEIPSIIQEFLKYARPLSQNKDCLQQICNLTSNISGALTGQKRLSLTMYEFEFDIRKRSEDNSNLNKFLCNTLEDSISIFRKNIELADKGLLSEILPIKYTKHDPFEWTKEWDNLIDEVDAKVYENLGIPIERYLGFCHTFWEERKKVFKELYGIDWRTPAEMNPEAMFD